MEKIIIQHVSKRFKSLLALNDVSVSFETGKIYGLIGRNGSGKTMLMRIICGLAAPTEGTVIVNGKKLGIDIDVPESIGAIIESPGFLPNKTGYENLKYLASLREKPDREKIEKTIQKCGLDPHSKKIVGKYSLGMKQRLGIAQAIMDDPDILILDEPMNGLDNQGVEDVKKLLKEMRSAGKTIVIASHHMEDIAELCDTVYTMENGCLREGRGLDAKR